MLADGVFSGKLFCCFLILDFFKHALSEHSSQNSTQGSQMAHVLSFNLLLKGPNASFSSAELVTAAACKKKATNLKTANKVTMINVIFRKCK